MRKLTLFLCAVAAVSLHGMSRRTFADSINAGDTLVQQAAGQTIALKLFITPGNHLDIGGLDLAVQIGDGGNTNSGTDTTPIITAVSFDAGTIFDGNNDSAAKPASPLPDLLYAGGTDANSTISLDGSATPYVFAILTIDASSALIGHTYSLDLDGVGQNIAGPPGLATDLTDGGGNQIALQIFDGSITIAGPSSVVAPLPGVASAGLAVLTLVAVGGAFRSRPARARIKGE